MLKKLIIRFVYGKPISGDDIINKPASFHTITPNNYDPHKLLDVHYFRDVSTNIHKHYNS
jgi:hypothetical protein